MSIRGAHKLPSILVAVLLFNVSCRVNSSRGDYRSDYLAASRFVYLLKSHQEQAYRNQGSYLKLNDAVVLTLQDINVQRYGLTITVRESEARMQPVLVITGADGLRFCVDIRGEACEQGSAPPLGNWGPPESATDKALQDSVEIPALRETVKEHPH